MEVVVEVEDIVSVGEEEGGGGCCFSSSSFSVRVASGESGGVVSEGDKEPEEVVMERVTTGIEKGT